MYEDLKRKELIEDLKRLVEKAEADDEDKKSYCEIMRTMILNTYSMN